jgi:hypothetical protein
MPGYRERWCEKCGGGYRPVTGNQLYCGVSCRTPNRVYARRYRERKFGRVYRDMGRKQQVGSDFLKILHEAKQELER